MRKKTKNLIFLSLIFCLLLLNINIVQAEAPKRNLEGSEVFLKTVGANIGYQTEFAEEEEPYRIILGQIISVALSLLGIFFLILVLIGGYQWMMAGGNEETIAKAKKRIINATIGLAVVLLAYAISYFIIYLLLEAQN